MIGSDLIVSKKSIANLNRWKRDIQVNYRPFLTVKSVNKVGRRHCAFCCEQNREIHLLSDGEFRAYLILKSLPGTIAVMEQYALDIDETVEIANELGVVHPRKYMTNTAIIMTTDFVVECMVNSEVKRIAYTFKYSNQIYENTTTRTPLAKSWRTWQKFDIERHYWQNKGVAYRIITELDATKEYSWNIQFCESYRDLSVSKETLALFINEFYETWFFRQKHTLKDLCMAVSKSISITPELSMKIFKHAVYHSYLQIEHKECLRPFRSVNLLNAPKQRR